MDVVATDSDDAVLGDIRSITIHFDAELIAVVHGIAHYLGVSPIDVDALAVLDDGDLVFLDYRTLAAHFDSALVNVLDGVDDMNDAEINDMFKEANKILKQADVSLDLDPNISRDVNDEGNGDDKIQSGEDAKLDEKGQDEINKKFGNGVGLKVYITNQIHGANDTLGCAPHVTEDANGNLEGKPIVYIKNDPCESNEDLGNTLAHEICHVLTLGDKDLVDINDGLKFEFSDSNGHVMDTNNLMHPSGTADSNGLTSIQRTEVFLGAARNRKKGRWPKKLVPFFAGMTI